MTLSHKILCNFAAQTPRDCSRSANATPHSDLGQRIASKLAWPSLNRSLAHQIDINHYNNDDETKRLREAFDEGLRVETTASVAGRQQR